MKKVTFIFSLVCLISFMMNAQTFSGKVNSKPDHFLKMAKPVMNYQSSKGPLSENFEGTFPPSLWSLPAGDDVWAQSTDADHTSGTGNSAIFDCYNISNGDIGYLQTPELAVTAGDVTFTFWVNYYSVGTTASDAGLYVDISTDGGTTYTNGTTDYITGTLVDTWTQYTIDLTANIGQNVTLRFRAISDYGYYNIAVDDVAGPAIYLPAHDLGVVEVSPTFILFGNSATPVVTVTNFGSSNETTFSVLLSDGGSYNQTINSAATLNSINSVDLTFPSWTPAAGTQTLTATVTLTGDIVASNDVLTQTVNVVAPSYTMGTLYGYNAYSSTLQDYTVTVDKTAGTLTGLLASTTTDFLSCGDYIDGSVYGVEYGTNDLYLVNGDGATYRIGTIAGVTGVTGIAYDATNDVVYLCDYATTSQLFTLDMSTLQATLVGEISAANLFIGIAAGNNGELWGIDITGSSLWSINTTTGVATVIGPLGVTISYAQDMGYDRAANILYGTLYTSTGGLYTIDVATGAATAVGTAFGDEVSMCAIAAEKTVSIEEMNTAVTLYPNPAENIVTVVYQGSSLLTISDLSGRIVYSSEINSTTNVSTSEFNAGVYIVKCEGNGTVLTSKLIVR